MVEGDRGQGGSGIHAVTRDVVCGLCPIGNVFRGVVRNGFNGILLRYPEYKGVAIKWKTPVGLVYDED